MQSSGTKPCLISCQRSGVLLKARAAPVKEITSSANTRRGQEMPSRSKPRTALLPQWPESST